MLSDKPYCVRRQYLFAADLDITVPDNAVGIFILNAERMFNAFHGIAVGVFPDNGIVRIEQEHIAVSHISVNLGL